MSRAKKPTDTIGGEGSDSRFGARDESVFDRTDPLVNVGHSDLLKDAFPGRSQPIINDPNDGMPRPDDDRINTQILPFNEDTFVCIADDRQWVEVFAEEGAKGAPVPETPQETRVSGQKWLVKRRSKWNADGSENAPLVFQRESVQRYFGLDIATHGGKKVLVRPIRPRCVHYTEQITVADDVDARPVYRFCAAYRTLAGAHWALFDESILACTSRSPRDLVSEKQLVRRNREKMQQGREQHMVDLIAPETDHELERVKKIVSDSEMLSVSFGVEPEPGYPSTLLGSLILMTPKVLDQLAATQKPNMIVLPEKEFQPRDAWFEHKAFRDGEFLKAGQGDAIVRIPIDDPEYTSEDDADTWPAFNRDRNPMLPMQILRNAQAAASSLRKGGVIYVIGQTLEGRSAFFAALTLYFVSKLAGESQSGLDCLEGVQENVGKECVTNYTHRMYLKRMT